MKMVSTQKQSKILFVGTERNCRSIAYVLDIKDYELTEKLTSKNFEQYKDYQIYVCEFKEKSNELIPPELLGIETKIQYLEDICRKIDNEKSESKIEKHYEYLEPCKGEREVVRKYLRSLSPAELLLYVLRAPINKAINCQKTEIETLVKCDGNIFGCCGNIIPLGNLLNPDEVNEIYNSTYARIIKLSSLNGSYCLCDLNRRCTGYCKNNNLPLTKNLNTPSNPYHLTIAFDQSCNLYCKSCRTKPYVMTDNDRYIVDTIVTKLLRSGWLDRVNYLLVAGNGEVFYSPYYRKLLITDLKRKGIAILSNGTLFNQNNWNLIAGKYSEINVQISVDAATAETYEDLRRGGNFNLLMKNLLMLSGLRRKNKIKWFQLNFVIQRANFREMVAFVKLGQKLGVDVIQFQRMNNFGHFTADEFRQECLIIDNKYLDYELWKILQSPIFKNSIVDLRGIQRYIDASEQLYRERYKKERKALFVGDERTCRSIAYVLDIKNYELTTRISADDIERYENYQIYVCEFKRKSKKLIDHKILKTGIDILYLEDICRRVDEIYYAQLKSNQEKNTQEPNKQFEVKQQSLKTDKAPVIQQDAKEPEIQSVQQNKLINKEQLPRQSLIKRIIRGLKHLLRATWHVVLRLKWKVKRIFKLVKKRIKHIFNSVRRLQKRTLSKASFAAKHYQYSKIDKKYKKYLYDLSASELMLYVLRAPINNHISCTRIETNVTINSKGNLLGCCSSIIIFGNLLKNNLTANELYNSIYARIVKLASLNRSYCLCDTYRWCDSYHTNNTPFLTPKWETQTAPNRLVLAFDQSCNLACKSCREKIYIPDESVKRKLTIITNKLSQSGWLDQVDSLTMAGMGEVFYSPYYRQLLTTNLQRKQINIKSNGILFNKSNWQIIADKYVDINADISVDAATPETYYNLRGADFNVLLKNLKMLGDLRRNGKIKWFQINFVVQLNNYREMPAFVELGRTLNVDKIQFQRMNNFKHSAKEEFQKQSLIIDNEYLDYELWCVLQNPIFQDSIVNLKGLQRYIDASEKRYRKCYKQEYSTLSA